MDRAQLIQELGKIVGSEYVVSDPDELKVYETDGLTIFKATPDVVVLPRNAEEVSNLKAKSPRVEQALSPEADFG